MGMNRRNVLIGLGGVTVGGGALIGAGAFSQVEAERTVTVNTTGDGSALLQFDVATDSYNGLNGSTDDNNLVTFTLTDINRGATTTFENALTVTNNGNNDVELTLEGANTVITFLGPNDNDLGDGNSVTLINNGGSADLDLVVDTPEDNSADGDQTVTFVASQ